MLPRIAVAAWRVACVPFGASTNDVASRTNVVCERARDSRYSDDNCNYIRYCGLCGACDFVAGARLGGSSDVGDGGLFNSHARRYVCSACH